MKTPYIKDIGVLYQNKTIPPAVVKRQADDKNADFSISFDTE